MKFLKIIIISILSGIIITLGTTFPILSMIIGLLAWPVLNLPGFKSTGKHVEYGHFWITLKSFESWIYFIIYYSLITFIILLFFSVLIWICDRIFKKK